MSQEEERGSESTPPESAAQPDATLASASPKVSWAAVLGIVVAVAVVAVGSSWQRDFWTQTELRTAEIAQEMALTDDWVTPTYAGEPFLRQPPLLFWIAGVVERFTSIDPRLGYRLAPIFFALLSLWITYLTGARLANRAVGFLAMVVQASSCFFLVSASWLDENLMFATLCQVSVVSLVFGSRPRGGWRGWVIVGWAALAGAALTKGLILALLIVCGTFLAFLFLENGFVSLVRGGTRLLFWPGPLVFLGLTVPWWVAIYRDAGGLFLLEHMQGFFRSDTHEQPIYEYLLALLGGFFPWSLHIVHGLYHGKDRMKRPGERYGAVGTFLPILVCVFFPAKKTDCLLLVWPPLCVLVAAAVLESGEHFSLWERYLKQGALGLARWSLRIPLVVCVVCAAAWGVDLASGSVWLPWLVSWPMRVLGLFPEPISMGAAPTPQARLETLFADHTAIAVPLFLFLTASAVAFWSSWRIARRSKGGAYGPAAVELGCVCLLLYFAATFVLGELNSVRSSRQFVNVVSTTVGSQPVGVYGRRSAAFYYYLQATPSHFPTLTRAQVDSADIERLREYVDRSDRVYLLASPADAALLKRDFPTIFQELRVAEAGWLGWTRAALLLVNTAE